MRINTAKLAHEQTERSRSVELTAFQHQLQISIEQQMMRQEDLAVHCAFMKLQQDALLQDQVKLEQHQQIQERAETALKLRVQRASIAP